MASARLHFFVSCPFRDPNPKVKFTLSTRDCKVFSLELKGYSFTEKVAEIWRMINYEVVCVISLRMPRIHKTNEWGAAFRENAHGESQPRLTPHRAERYCDNNSPEHESQCISSRKIQQHRHDLVREPSQSNMRRLRYDIRNLGFLQRVTCSSSTWQWSSGQRRPGRA
jgi:hypothetical protein